MCIVCIANNINRNVYMYLNTRIFPTTGYTRVLLFMFIRRELGGTGTGCLFQFTYCVVKSKLLPRGAMDDLMHYCTRPKSECNSASGRPRYRGLIVDYTTNRHEITVLLPNPFDAILSSVY